MKFFRASLRAQVSGEVVRGVQPVQEREREIDASLHFTIYVRVFMMFYVVLLLFILFIFLKETCTVCMH